MHFEGAAAYTLSTGVNLGEHGLYYPWLWSATEQRVRFFDEVPAPELSEELMSALRAGDPARLGAALGNDLQVPALALFPALMAYDGRQTVTT